MYDGLILQKRGWHKWQIKIDKTGKLLCIKNDML